MDAPNNNNNNGTNKGKEVIPNTSQDVAAMDPQRLRRTMLNRQYARTFRQKQQNRTQGLLTNKADESEKLENLNPKVEILRGQVMAWRNGNAVIRYRMNQMRMLASIANEELERLKMEKGKLFWDLEIERLMNFDD